MIYQENYRSIKQLSEPDINGGNLLEDSKFVKSTFREFLLGFGPNTKMRLRNVDFIGTKLSAGRAMLGRFTELENVLFEEFQCAYGLSIDSGALLDGVSIVGKKYPSSLFVKRVSLDFEPDYKPVDGWSLDIREYFGNVEIYNVPKEKVLMDPSRQFVFDSRLLDVIPWEEIGIDVETSFIYSSFRFAKTSSTGYTIGAAPSKKKKTFMAEMRDIEILRDNGFL